MSNSTFYYLVYGTFALSVVFSFFFIYKLIKEILKFIQIYRHKDVADILRLQRSVIVLMAQMLRANRTNDVPFKKIVLICNYINLVFKDKKQRNDSFDILLLSVKKVDYSYNYIKLKEFIDKIKNEWQIPSDNNLLEHGLAVDVNASGDKLDTQTFSFNLQPCESAEELSKYLNQFQLRYLAYLLLRIAMTDNSISSKAEASLKDICVKCLKLPEGEFNEMCGALKNNQLDIWYQQYIQPLKPAKRLNSDDLLNVFAADEDDSFKDVQSPQLSLSFFHKYLPWFVIPQIAVMLFSFEYVFVVVSFVILMILLIVVVLLGFKVFCSFAPSSEMFCTLYTQKDIKYGTKCLLFFALDIIFTVTLFVFLLPATFYHIADIRYANVKEVKTNILAMDYSHHRVNRKKGRSYTVVNYYFYFPEISSSAFTGTPKKEMQSSDKRLLMFLDKLTCSFFKLCDSTVSKVEVTGPVYVEHKINDDITIFVTEGAYGNTINAVFVR